MELNDRLLDYAGGDPFSAVRRRSETHQAEHGCGLHNAGGPVMATIGAITRATGAQRILDLGSGLGYPTLWLAHSAEPAAHVTGIDADPAELRLALYQAANVTRRRDPQLAEHYRRLMVERDHNHISANTAIARKLACRAWAIATTGRPYQPRDLNGEPIHPDHAVELAISLAVTD